jgi:hypothetical protein
MKGSASVLLAVLVLLVMFVPAAAKEPVLLVPWYLGPGPEDDWEVGPEFVCDGYPIMDNEVASGGITAYYNKDGNVTKVVGEWSGTDNLYTAAHPEIVLSGRFGWKWTGTEFTGEYYENEPLMRYYHWRGVGWNINAPGMPNLYHEVGTSFSDFEDRENPIEVKRAGLRTVDIDGLCKALGF